MTMRTGGSRSHLSSLIQIFILQQFRSSFRNPIQLLWVWGIKAILGLSFKAHIFRNKIQTSIDCNFIIHQNILNISMKSSLTENPDLDTMLPVCCAPLMRVTRILFFEFFASFIVTFGTMVSYGSYPHSSYTQIAFISLSMFFAFVVSGQTSGGQANPIITLALVFTKGSNVTILNSLIYILFQFVGSIVAGAVAYGTKNYGYPFPDHDNYALSFGSQILGSFMFIILYLIIMSNSTKMESNFWCYILVPCAYYMSGMISMQYTGLNPAAILSNQIFYGVKSGNYTPLSTCWVYICGPVIGGLAATLIFNFFLLPIHKANKKGGAN